MDNEKAQALIQVLKKIIDRVKEGVLIPKAGEQMSINLESVFSKKDSFTIFFNRKGRINPNRYSILLRYLKDTVLLRLDVDGPPHGNPDGTKLPCPHFHIWTDGPKNGYAWAYEVPAIFVDTEDHLMTFIQFLQYCNVNNIDSIEIREQKEMVK